MSKSVVYFTDFRTGFYGKSLPAKLQALMKMAGFETLPLKDKFVAIKLHFGELGNLAYLRPQYAKAVADYVKQLKGLPFLTDCNTLYAGSRKNALEHLETAALNGYSQVSTGCQIIIGDGLKGGDEVEVPVPNGVHCKTAKIGRAIMDADVVISLTHFKGHEKMGIGGAVKNIGMGCGSRTGKMVMHSDCRPIVMTQLCIGCGICKMHCAHEAITIEKGHAQVNHGLCAGCGACISVCPKCALSTQWEQSTQLLDEKTAEYAAAVLAGRPHFHISLLCDISPNCDCHGENDAPILPNIGMLASFDPVAIDMAACDLCNQEKRLHNSWMDDCKEGEDVFDDAHPETHWRDAMDHAVKLGLGSEEYELVKM